MRKPFQSSNRPFRLGMLLLGFLMLQVCNWQMLGQSFAYPSVPASTAMTVHAATHESHGSPQETPRSHHANSSCSASNCVAPLMRMSAVSMDTPSNNQTVFISSAALSGVAPHVPQRPPMRVSA